MSKKGNGFFGNLLLLFRLIFTTVFTLAVFVLLLGFIGFRCMYPAGSRMLAATLSSYPVVNILPRIYYSSSELEEITANQAALTDEDTAQDDSADPTLKAQDIRLAETQKSVTLPDVEGSDVLHLNGLYVVENPVSPFEETPAADLMPEEAEASEKTVLYGCVNGAMTTYLRLTPSFDAAKKLTIEPGEWVIVLEEEKLFYKISYADGEYYINKDRLDVVEVPDLPEGLSIPGLEKASEEEIVNPPSKENEASQEADTRVMCGFVKGITPYRTTPSFAEAQAGFLEADTHFRIIEDLDPFYKIELDGNEYYVYKIKVTVYYEEASQSAQSGDSESAHQAADSQI